MSYLSTLVGTPPAASRPVAAETAPGMAASLEQHVEVEAGASPPAGPPTAQQDPAPPAERPAPPVARARPPAGVEDALQAAFAWVASPPLPDPATPDAPQRPVPAAALEIDALAPSAPAQREPFEVPPERRGPVLEAETPRRPLPTAAGAAARSQPPDAPDMEEEAAEPLRFEPPARREPMPSRAPGAAGARQRPAAEDEVASRRVEPQPAGVHVRIGSIALHVRTPPASPAPAPAPPAAAPAAPETARQPSPAFAFSARRHHLRWN